MAFRRRMAEPKSQVSVSAQARDIVSSCPVNPLLITAKEIRRLLEGMKNETGHGQSRRAFESALSIFSKIASENNWNDSNQRANLMTLCADIMSDVLSTNNVDLIKLALFNLAAWLVPKSISGIASACQQYGWNAMVDT